MFFSQRISLLDLKDKMANRPLSFGISGDENFDEMITFAADTIKSRISAQANDTFPNISTSNLLFKLGETN